MPTNNAPVQPEKLPANESSQESVSDQAVEVAPEAEVTSEQVVQTAPVQEVEETNTQAAPAPAVDETAPIQAEKDPEVKKVEDIMSEGLEELYSDLPDNRKTEFKQKGEETAGKIVTLMHSAKVKMSKVVGLLRDWLKMVPGVNKYFLEQESKIKADQIMEASDSSEEAN